MTPIVQTQSLSTASVKSNVDQDTDRLSDDHQGMMSSGTTGIHRTAQIAVLATFGLLGVLALFFFVPCARRNLRRRGEKRTYGLMDDDEADGFKHDLKNSGPSQASDRNTSEGPISRDCESDDASEKIAASAYSRASRIWFSGHLNDASVHHGRQHSDYDVFRTRNVNDHEDSATVYPPAPSPSLALRPAHIRGRQTPVGRRSSILPPVLYRHQSHQAAAALEARSPVLDVDMEHDPFYVPTRARELEYTGTRLHDTQSQSEGIEFVVPAPSERHGVGAVSSMFGRMPLGARTSSVFSQQTINTDGTGYHRGRQQVERDEPSRPLPIFTIE